MRIPARIVEKNTMLVPETVLLQHAALTEPLGCVVHGFNATAAQAGDTMVVIGAGPIGLMFIHVAQLSGLRAIAVVKGDDQVGVARRLGAAAVGKIGDGVATVATGRKLTRDGRGADVVVEAVATPTAW